MVEVYSFMYYKKRRKFSAQVDLIFGRAVRSFGDNSQILKTEILVHQRYRWSLRFGDL